MRERVRRGFLLVGIPAAREQHVGRDAALVDGLVQRACFGRQSDLGLVDGGLLRRGYLQSGPAPGRRRGRLAGLVQLELRRDWPHVLVVLFAEALGVAFENSWSAGSTLDFGVFYVFESVFLRRRLAVLLGLLADELVEVEGQLA